MIRPWNISHVILKISQATYLADFIRKGVGRFKDLSEFLVYTVVEIFQYQKLTGLYFRASHKKYWCGKLEMWFRIMWPPASFFFQIFTESSGKAHLLQGIELHGLEQRFLTWNSRTSRRVLEGASRGPHSPRNSACIWPCDLCEIYSFNWNLNGNCDSKYAKITAYILYVLSNMHF